MESYNETLPALIAVGGIMVYLAILFGVFILSVIIVCRIVAKAGYPWPLGLLWFVPCFNVILLAVFAFSEWPVERELRNLKSVLTAQPGPRPPQFP
mgnify:CR=1 FL=1